MRILASVLFLAVAGAQQQLERPSEYAVLTPVEMPGLVPHHYVVQKPPTLIARNGTVETCPSSFGLLPATDADPYGYQVVIASSGSTTNTLGFSRRCVMVTRWATSYRGQSIEWLSQGTSIGGNGLGFNERRFAHYGLASQEQHNPTFGGCVRLPYREGPYFSSVPLHAIVTPTLIEGAVVPLEWDPNGSEAGSSDHGGDPLHPVLAWREREFARVDLNWQGRANVHRITYWGYHPDGWLAGTGLDPVLCYVAPTTHVRGRMFDKGYFVDLLTQTVFELPHWTPPSATEPHHVRYAAAKDSMVVVRPDGSVTNEPSPFPSGYAGSIMRRTSDDFTLGWALRIHAISDQCRRPTAINMIQHVERYPVHPIPMEFDETSVCELVAKAPEGRAAGWVGFVYYLVIGEYQQVLQTMQTLRSSGALDQSPPKGLPTLGGVKPP